MSIKPNTVTMQESEYEDLLTLNYRELCNLNRGDLIVCVDQGNYTFLVQKGTVYEIQGHTAFGRAIILDCDEDQMELDESDDHLFAKVGHEISADEIKDVQLKLLAMTTRALKAEARVEAARSCIENLLNCPTEDEHGEGVDSACREILEEMGLKETEGAIKITIKE